MSKEFWLSAVCVILILVGVFGLVIEKGNLDKENRIFCESKGLLKISSEDGGRVIRCVNEEGDIKYFSRSEVKENE